MRMMYFILIFFLGTAVGSFVNVLIDRSVAGKDWISGRSRCDHCHKTLTWYDLIPILSFLVYRGKSRCCKTPLSYQYPIVELLVGLLFLWWAGMGFWFFQLVSSPLLSVLQPGFWLVMGIVLAILALADLIYGVVLMGVVWFGVAITLIYRLILLYHGAYQMGDLINSLLVGAGCFGFFYLLYKLTKGRGMAEGDMYVALMLGHTLGWPRGVMAIMLSFVIGAAVGVVLMASGLRSRKDTLPFVPFMVSGAVIALLWGEQLQRILFLI